MKKIVLFFAVLLMTVPAMGSDIVTISCAQTDVNEVTVSYSVTPPDTNLVRGFGLTIEAENANITKMTPEDPCYRIFPGQIDIEYGEITDYNYPYEQDDLGDANLTIEMGSLYTLDSNHASDPCAGYGMKPGSSGVLFKFYVNRTDGKFGYYILENAARGGVVMEDPDEEPEVIIGDCNSRVVRDYGDAPDEPYPTLLARNGARHIVWTDPVGPILGTVRDIEPDGLPNATATGDDANQVPDDEDGVTNILANRSTGIGSADVYVTQDCNLNAWIDFTQDGDWADPCEQIFTDEALTGPGTNNLVFSVPADACLGYTFSRWRVSTAGGDNYVGEAEDGEVEDYHEPNVIGGPILCHVPDVVGEPCDVAKAMIIAENLVVGDITWVYSDDVAYKVVISTDPCYCNYVDCESEVNMVISDGSDCYVGMADFDEWTDAGRPICWCYPRQCHGDADGKKQGTKKIGYTYVDSDDLDIMSIGWLVKDPPKGSGILGLEVNGVPAACADFAHNKQGTKKIGYTRVDTDDLDLMSAYWLVKEPDKGSGTPANCSPGNRTP